MMLSLSSLNGDSISSAPTHQEVALYLTTWINLHFPARCRLRNHGVEEEQDPRCFGIIHGVEEGLFSKGLKFYVETPPGSGIILTPNRAAETMLKRFNATHGLFESKNSVNAFVGLLVEREPNSNQYSSLIDFFPLKLRKWFQINSFDPIPSHLQMLSRIGKVFKEKIESSSVQFSSLLPPGDLLLNYQALSRLPLKNESIPKINLEYTPKDLIDSSLLEWDEAHPLSFSSLTLSSLSFSSLLTKRSFSPVIPAAPPSTPAIFESNKKLKLDEPSRICPFCFDSYDSSDIMYTCSINVQHHCCYTCLAHYVTSKCKEPNPIFPLLCMHSSSTSSSSFSSVTSSNCTCELPNSLIATCLSPTEYETYLTVGLKSLREQDFLCGKVMEIKCPSITCGQIFDVERVTKGVELIFWCNCGTCFCTGCRAVLSTYDDDSHVGCYRAEIHAPIDGPLDIGIKGVIPTAVQLHNLLETFNRAIQKASPHCPTCNRTVQKFEGCNMITCVCNTSFCYVCSRKFVNNGVEYKQGRLKSEDDKVAYMQHMDGDPIIDSDEQLNGLLHQRNGSRRGSHQHIPENPRLPNRLCPHNLQEYWTQFHCEEYKEAVTNANSKDAELLCIPIFLSQCMVRGLQNVFKQLNDPVRFYCALRHFPHRNDSIILRTFPFLS